MGELEPTKHELLPNDWSYRENQNVRELLDLIARILAEEYVEYMSNAEKRD